MTLISENYKNLLTELYEIKFFSGGIFKLGLISEHIDDSFTSIVDFGCGQGELIKEIKKHYPVLLVYGYDPGVKEFQEVPKVPADFLISLDVLEHIEPEFLEDNLRLIDSLFTKKALLVIASYPAGKILPTGKNAHLIVEDDRWWEEKIKKYISGTITDKVSKDVGKGFEHRYIIEKNAVR